MRALIVKLALLTAAGLGSLGWLAVTIGQLNGPAGTLSHTYTVRAMFTDATGLTGGDPVRLAGVQIGKVGTVTVAHGQARVAMHIDRAYRIPAGATFQLHWRNLLGQRYVEAQPPAGASATGPAIRPGTVVPADRTGAAADLSTLLDNTEPLLANLDTQSFNTMMETLAAALQGRQQVLGQAISNSSQLVADLSARADAIGSSIGNLATVVGTISAHDQQVQQLLDALASTSSAVAARTGDLGRALGSTDVLTSVLAQILATSGGGLSTATAELQRLAAVVAGDKQALAEGIRSLPWTSAALIRSTNSGDWMLIYGRGFGLINTGWTPETMIGPNYSNVGPDDTTAPGPLLGSPKAPVPPVPSTGAGPVAVNPGSTTTTTTPMGGLLGPLLPGGGG